MLAAAGLAILAATPRLPVAADRYAVTVLPFVPFSSTGGEALSNRGVVAGGVAEPDGSVALAEWSNGVLTRVAVPPGLPTHEFSRLRVFGINSAGAIVGTVHTPAGDMPARSFIYDRATFTVLPLVDPTDLGGAAIGINERGAVVGYDRTATNEAKGWLWVNGAYASLPVSGTDTAAFGINSGGTIIGNRTRNILQRLLAGEICCPGEQGYVVSNGKAQYLDGFVYAINDRGVAAGGSNSDGRSAAAVFDNGVTRIILSPPSFAVGINSQGEVVGSYQPAASNLRHLFMWNAHTGGLDLTPGGYRSAEAAAINDRGEVLGFGATASGTSQYFLLAPDPQGPLIPKALNSSRAPH